MSGGKKSSAAANASSIKYGAGSTTMLSIRYLLPRIIVAVFVVVTVIDCLTLAAGLGKVSGIREIKDYKVRVLYKDGRSAWYNQDYYPVLNAGDTITYYLMVPEDMNPDNYSLCFYQYHSVISVRVDGKAIYEWGIDERQNNRMYGNEYCMVPMSEYNAGKAVTVAVKQMEGSNSNHRTYFALVPQDQVRWYPLNGNRLYFVLYGAIFSFAVLAIVLLVVLSFMSEVPLLPGLYLFIFAADASAWQLSSKRLFYVLFANTQICSVSEYVTLYSCLVPLFLFLGEEHTDIRMRRIYRGAASVLGAIFAVVMTLHLTGIRHLVWFESTIYTAEVISIVLTMLSEIVISRDGRTEHMRVIRYGYLAAGVLAIIQKVFLTASSILPPNRFTILLSRSDMISVSIIVMLCDFGFILVQGLVRSSIKLEEEKQAEYMAYHDLLTGMHNRAYCERAMDEITIENAYAIFFFDVDHLKMANDRYGHEIADMLICATARMISMAAGGIDAFAGRWGGDEFIMVLRDINKLSLVSRRLDEGVKAVNESGIFEFDFSVSCGTAMHFPGDEEDISAVRILADKRMYENKALHHASRV